MLLILLIVLLSLSVMQVGFSKCESVFLLDMLAVINTMGVVLKKLVKYIKMILKNQELKHFKNKLKKRVLPYE